MNVDGDSAAAAGAAFPADGAAAVGGDRPEDKFTDKKQTTHTKKYFLPFQELALTVNNAYIAKSLAKFT